MIELTNTINDAIAQINYFQSSGLFGDADSVVLIAAFTIAVMSAIFSFIFGLSSDNKMNKGGKLGFKIIATQFSIIFAILFAPLSLTENQLTALNTLQTIQGHSLYASDDYVSHHTIGNEIAGAERFLNELHSLNVKLEALGVEPTDELVFALTSSQ